MPQECSDVIQEIKDDSHPVQVEVECHHNKATGQHKGAAKGFMHLPNERESVEDRSYTVTHQQVTVATAFCDPTPSPVLTATLSPSTASPSVSSAFLPSYIDSSQHCF
jgi:hypothetical protein